MSDKKTVLPKLRFQEFNSYPEWEITTLGAISEPIEEKVGSKNCILMSVTAGKGLVPQKEKFGREIAGNSYKNYYVIRENDFAYNKSATKQFPEGYIAMLTDYDEAALPNSIFTCFRITEKECVPAFINHLFQSNYHGKWLRKYIEVGARAHGSLNVDCNYLWSMPIALPKKKEQEKIALVLDEFEKLIEKESYKLNTLQEHKKGLMQKLFPKKGEKMPEWRLPIFKDEKDWICVQLGSICSISTGKLDANAMVSNGAFRFYTCAKEYYYIDKYAFDTEALLISGNGANVGYIHYFNGKFNAYQRTYVLTDFCKNINYIKYFLEKNLHDRIRTEKNEGNTPYIVLSTLTDMKIWVPQNSEEQKKIAEILTTIDNLILLQTEKIRKLNFQRKGLIRQLFPSLEEVIK